MNSQHGDVNGRLPIVVGVDGSDAALAAVRWAADEARLRTCPLHLVHCYTTPTFATQPVLAPYDWKQVFEREAEAILSHAAETARADVPDLSVTVQTAVGDPVKVLTGLSDRAAMLVVGHRGKGGFPGLGLGSVALAVAGHASGPAVVVRTGELPETAAAVTVGVDGSRPNQPAVEFAFREADLHGAPLRAVHARQPLPIPYTTDITGGAAAQEAATEQLHEWLSPWLERYPRVSTELKAEAGSAAGCILEAARDSALLVVGSRGLGGFTRLLLGSVSHQVVRHAHRPVAVVR